jgi:hypothetical protein
MNKSKLVPYNPELGRMATLELYALRNNKHRREDERRWNWRLLGANGEPLARGSGERNGGFSTPIRAWYNALLTASIFHGALPQPMPKVGKPMMVINGDARPHLRVRRVS